MESLRAKAFRTKTGLQKRVDEKEPKRPIFHALMGDGTGGDPRTHCQVDGEPNLVYVRVTGRGVMQAIYNQDLPVRHDLPVLVGPTQENPDLYEVLGLDQAAWTGPGTYRYMGLHHEAHEFRNENGGDDVVWVQKSQFVPLLGSPTDPASMEIYIQPGFYLYLTDWQYWPGGNADLTGHLPAVGLARYVLASIDAATNTAALTDGADFAIFPPTNPSANIPACPSGHFPITAVYLLDTTTEVTWDNLYDVRLMVGGGVNTTVPGPHHFIDTVTHDDTVAYTPPTTGDLIYGDDDTPPYWEVLPIGASYQLMYVSAPGLGPIPQWISFNWGAFAAAVGSDMVHDHSNDNEGGQDLNDLNTITLNPETENVTGVDISVPYHSYLLTHSVNIGGDWLAGIEDDNVQRGAICFVQRDDGVWDTTILNNWGIGDRPVVLASGHDYVLDDQHPLLLVLNDNDNKWYEIGWTGSAGGAGAHNLLSATHGDTTAASPPGRGSILRSEMGLTWHEYPYPGDRHHLQTDDQDVIWDQDISMEPDHWIGLGDVTGYGGGMARIVFINGGLGRDVMAHLDGDVGIGTEEPNIAEEAVGLTIESSTGAPTFELSLKDDLFGLNQLIGTIRWWAGVDTPCNVGQIDVIQDSWYETQSTMRFWATDDCALCLIAEMDCDEVEIHGDLEVDGNVGVNIAPSNAIGINAYDTALESASTFYGIQSYYVKTSGAGGAGDDYYGIHTYMEIDQSTTANAVRGIRSTGKLTQGTISAIAGGAFTAEVDGGTVTGNTIGFAGTANIDGGMLDAVTAIYANVDVEAAAQVNTVIHGIFIQVDDDDNTCTSYMLYMNELSNVDYGMFQNGSAPNVLGGTIAAVYGDHWGLGDYHAGTVTDTGYVDVDINGVAYQFLVRLPP